MIQAQPLLKRVVRKLNSVLNYEAPDPLLAFIQTNVRQSIPSFMLSADDDVARPSAKLVKLVMNAGLRAQEIDLKPIAKTFAPDMANYLQLWPGEHYRFLAALVELTQPKLIIEIGTGTGSGALTMKSFLPADGKVVTYDVVPWQQMENTGIRAEHIDSQFEQRTCDLTQASVAETQASLFREADMIFVDALKDGFMERYFAEWFDKIGLPKNPLVVFDDIHMKTSLPTWRKIPYSKFNATSLGHWTGTGLVEWGKKA